MTTGVQELVFQVRVFVRTRSVRESERPNDLRPVHEVVADEIASNLESVSYVTQVSVRRDAGLKGDVV